MPKHGKKFQDAVKKVDADTPNTPQTRRFALLKEIAYANFDETVEVHARLGIDPRQADQSSSHNRDPPARHRQAGSRAGVRRR